MDNFRDENGMIPFPQYYANDLGLIDFMDESNLHQFIDLIRGENDQTDHDNIHQPVFNLFNQDYGYCGGDQSINVAAAVDDCHFLPPPPPNVGLFDFEAAAAGHDEFGLLNAACEVDPEEEEEYLMDDQDESSGGSGVTTAPGVRNGGGKADRSKTLVSERRRRGRMKEKLYALRSLVPNITKMDKASIVGDAVLYVQDLQNQAKKMKAEIAGFEENYKHKTTQNGIQSNPSTCFYPTPKIVFKMEVSQVEERGFYVKIVANKGHGVAAALYRSLESLTTFDVRSSNLTASADHNYVFTFTLHTMEGEMEVNLQSVKVWIARVFLNQGFDFQTSQ
ncbi:transcription factor FER-LIKE IRON DEFICIENCY-INDUCED TRANSCRIPTION FACTOR-like [Salvia divinorum]|uniref:Transcription factor FER-LIKE IRON DEFICIENCY-INDUCED TRANSCRIPTION FACTOR-like n=1 Tax=Salvia divinorum TaxID=28513 RepID=A0ABD1HN18_SALDI